MGQHQVDMEDRDTMKDMAMGAIMSLMEVIRSPTGVMGVIRSSMGGTMNTTGDIMVSPQICLFNIIKLMYALLFKVYENRYHEIQHTADNIINSRK